MDTNEFIKKSKSIFGNKYSYNKTEYVNAKKPVTITCPIHGDFLIRPGNHLSLKRGCTKGCSKKACDITRKTNDYFIENAIKRHGDKYDYSLVEYKNSKSKVKIVCPKHGIFEQSPSNHYKYGCLECGRDLTKTFLKNNENSFSKSGYKSISKNRECTLYIIECYNECEKFYKIGITVQTVKRRFHIVSSMPYNFKVLKEIKGSAEDMWELENNLKRNLRYKYEPKIKFPGSARECFSDIDEIFKLL